MAAVCDRLTIGPEKLVDFNGGLHGLNLVFCNDNDVARLLTRSESGLDIAQAKHHL
jgi:hypothetical protein